VTSSIHKIHQDVGDDDGTEHSHIKTTTFLLSLGAHKAFINYELPLMLRKQPIVSVNEAYTRYLQVCSVYPDRVKPFKRDTITKMMTLNGYSVSSGVVSHE
jgi:hypothetical protein